MVGCAPRPKSQPLPRLYLRLGRPWDLIPFAATTQSFHIKKSTTSLANSFSENDILAKLNSHSPGFIKLLGGQIVATDLEARSCTFTFCVPLAFCHSGNIVQGGFVSAMLDAAMSHAVFSCDPSVERLSSLEITTRYESVTRGENLLTVTGWVRRMTRTIAFLEADIRSESAEILAVAHSVAKIGRKA